jgi:2-dehydro-3-deoxy-D-arabinonate dehydratase
VSTLVRYATGGAAGAAVGGEVGVGVRTDDVVRVLHGVTDMADLLARPLDEIRRLTESADRVVDGTTLLAPVDGRTEVWAAGVTYERSREARQEESADADVYGRVYSAERPELFFKSVAWRVVTDGEPVGIRADSTLDVPEPELALVVNAHREIVGYTVCNDMSSRSIEGENPLYLPQAKVYAGACALASGVRPVWEVPDPRTLAIEVTVRRAGAPVWEAATSTARLHRRLDELVDWLFRELTFPAGVVLATGTGVAPDLDFSLEAGDQIEIAIEGVGVLSNPVERGLR